VHAGAGTTSRSCRLRRLRRLEQERNTGQVFLQFAPSHKAAALVDLGQADLGIAAALTHLRHVGYAWLQLPATRLRNAPFDPAIACVLLLPLFRFPSVMVAWRSPATESNASPTARRREVVSEVRTDMSHAP
jgi:hypothetical protein